MGCLCSKHNDEDKDASNAEAKDLKAPNVEACYEPGDSNAEAKDTANAKDDDSLDGKSLLELSRMPSLQFVR